MRLSVFGIVGLSLLLLSGCVTHGNPAVLDHQITDQVKIGQSSKEDMRRLFGDPTYTSVVQDGSRRTEVWGYGYMKHETNPCLYVPIVGLFVWAAGGWANHESGNVVVSFDQEGLVRSITKQQSAFAMGGLAGPTTVSAHTQTDRTPTDIKTFGKK